MQNPNTSIVPEVVLPGKYVVVFSLDSYVKDYVMIGLCEYFTLIIM